MFFWDLNPRSFINKYETTECHVPEVHSLGVLLHENKQSFSANK